MARALNVVAKSCYHGHEACRRSYVQTAVDVDLIIECLKARGRLKANLKGKFILMN